MTERSCCCYARIRYVATRTHTARQSRANARWAKEKNRFAATAPGLRAAFKYYEDQVDPERKLPEKQRRRMAQNARRAHLLNMSRKAVKARRLAKGGAANGDAA